MILSGAAKCFEAVCICFESARITSLLRNPLSKRLVLRLLLRLVFGCFIAFVISLCCLFFGLSFSIFLFFYFFLGAFARFGDYAIK